MCVCECKCVREFALSSPLEMRERAEKEEREPRLVWSDDNDLRLERHGAAPSLLSPLQSTLCVCVCVRVRLPREDKARRAESKDRGRGESRGNCLPFLSPLFFVSVYNWRAQSEAELMISAPHSENTFLSLAPDLISP